MDFIKTINSISKVLLLCFMFICSALSAVSAGNIVCGISVSQDDTGKYNILLKLENISSVKKVYDGKSLILTIPKALPSDTMEIIYDNAVDLQNITVQKKNFDNTTIVMQGDNIQNCRLFIKDISTGLTKKITNSNSILDSLSFIPCKKISAVFVLILLFRAVSAFGPEPEQKKSGISANPNVFVKSNNKSMTLRRKNMTQSYNIPSINYMRNGSFKASSMSIPADFIINDNMKEQQIRKAG